MVLSILALVVLVLMEKNPKLGWWIVIGEEFIWIYYDILTKQYCFLAIALAYFIVAINRLKNLRRKENATSQL